MNVSNLNAEKSIFHYRFSFVLKSCFCNERKDARNVNVYKFDIASSKIGIE